MVHLWISLQNDRISAPCVNARVTRIFKDPDVLFYGDYCLAIFIGTRHDYPSLESAVEAATERGPRWTQRCGEVERTMTKYISHIIGEFGVVSERHMRKIFPRRQDLEELVDVSVYRYDGNFKMLACSTQRYHYVFAFDTS